MIRFCPRLEPSRETGDGTAAKVEEEEADPLDAFMAEIDTQVQKEAEAPSEEKVEKMDRLPKISRPSNRVPKGLTNLILSLPCHYHYLLQIRRDDIEDEDEIESYMKHMKRKGITIGQGGPVRNRDEVT